MCECFCGVVVVQAFAQLADEFTPMVAGCETNRRNWLILAEGGTLEDVMSRRPDEEDSETQPTSSWN